MINENNLRGELSIDTENSKIGETKDTENSKIGETNESQSIIEELKKEASERVNIVQGGVDNLIQKTTGWDEDSQPEYKKIMKQYIDKVVKKSVDLACKQEGLALVQGSYYENILNAFSLVEGRISRISIIEENSLNDELNEKDKIRLMSLAEHGGIAEEILTPIGTPGRAGIPVYKWEVVAKNKINK